MAFEPDAIDLILDEAEDDNPAAQYIVASALESAGENLEAARWYRRSADQGYRPALERLGVASTPPPEFQAFQPFVL
jgi:TPR repeat protein